MRSILTRSEQLWSSVLALANRDSRMQVKISTSECLPLSRDSGVRHLEISRGDSREPIDIFRVDPSKSVPRIVDALVSKVIQHTRAKRVPGIYYSSWGSKLDTRLMPKKYHVIMDPEGHITVNGCEVPLLSKSESRLPFSSCSIIRAVFHEGKIRFFDEDVSAEAISPIPTIEMEGNKPLRMSQSEEIDLSLREHFKYLLENLDP